MAEKFSLKVRIKPNAKKNEIVGFFEETLEIKIKAPPIDNLANNELISFIAKHYKVPQKNVKLVKGKKSRTKTLCIIKTD